MFKQFISRAKSEVIALGRFFDAVTFLGLAFLGWMIYLISTYKGGI